MPTPLKGPRLGGSPQHQRLLLSNLATALFEHGRITTTQAKAKALRPLAEKLITFAKKGDIHARRQVLTVVRDKSVVHTLFAEIGPRFAERPGGYTRITKVGPRKGDNAPMAVIELVESRTIAQEAVGEAERARGTRFAPRRGKGGAATATEGTAAATEATPVSGGDAPVDDAPVDDAAVDDSPADATAAEALDAAAVASETAAAGGDGTEATEDVAAEDTAAEGGELPDTGSGAGNQAESARETSQAEGEDEPSA